MNQMSLDVKILRAQRKVDEIFRQHFESFYGVEDGTIQSEAGRQLGENSGERSGQPEQVQGIDRG